MSELLREPEAAKLLGVKASTLRFWRLQGFGGPKWIRLGARIVVYDPSDLNDYVAARRVNSTSEADARIAA